MRFNRFHFEFESAFGLQANEAVRKDGIRHLLFAAAYRTSHGFYLQNNGEHFDCQVRRI